MARKKSYGRMAKYVNTPEAMTVFCHHYGIPDGVRVSELGRRSPQTIQRSRDPSSCHY